MVNSSGIVDNKSAFSVQDFTKLAITMSNDSNLTSGAVRLIDISIFFLGRIVHTKHNPPLVRAQQITNDRLDCYSSQLVL